MKKKIIITSIIIFVILISAIIFNFTYNFAEKISWNDKYFSDGSDVMEYIGAQRNNKITFVGKNQEYTYTFQELGIMDDLSGASEFPKIKKLGKKTFFKTLFGEKVEYTADVNYVSYKVEEALKNISPNEIKEKLDSLYEINKETKTINIKNGHKGYKIDEIEFKKLLKKEIQDFEKDLKINIPYIEYDYIKIDANEINDQIKIEPINMKIYDDGSITKIIYPENGLEINQESLDKIKESNLQEDIEYSINFSEIEPEIKNVDLSPLFKETMGEYTTTYSTSDSGRTANVELSAKFINDIVLNPGDTFSYTDLVGPTTADKGYKTANVFVNGKVEKGLGGGICQTSSTLYVAVLNANLEIVERHNHSLFVSYVPKAFDATVATGILDFKFKNNYNFPIKISAIGNNGKLTIKILGEKKLSDVKLYNKLISSNANYETWGLYRDITVDGEYVEKNNKINSSTYKK